MTGRVGKPGPGIPRPGPRRCASGGRWRLRECVLKGETEAGRPTPSRCAKCCSLWGFFIFGVVSWAPSCACLCLWASGEEPLSSLGPTPEQTPSLPAPPPPADRGFVPSACPPILLPFPTDAHTHPPRRPSVALVGWGRKCSALAACLAGSQAQSPAVCISVFSLHPFWGGWRARRQKAHLAAPEQGGLPQVQMGLGAPTCRVLM